jgi:aminopeptidase N
MLKVIIFGIILLHLSESFRLPSNSIPLAYNLKLKTDIDKNDLKFTGSVYLRIRIIEPSNTITLHSRKLTITFIDLYNQNNSITAQNLNYTTDTNHDFIIIQLPSNQLKNAELSLAIFYTGTLSDNMMGFYHTFYVNENFEQIPLALTHFQPINARSAFPCYDEPQMQAVFRLEIVHNKNYKAASNMLPIAIIPEETNYLVTKFEETPPISTCSLAFVVSNLASMSNNKKFNQTIVGQVQKITQGEGDFALKVIEKISEKYSDIFGNLPIKKTEHFAIPNTNQGVPNFGLMTYEEDSLFLNFNFSSKILEYFKPQIISTISLYYGSLYFGNIVSLMWWKYLWLNYGFATFFQFHISSVLYHEYNFNERFRNEIMHFAFDIDGELNSITMNDNAESSREIYEKFNPITFAKAAVVIRMFYEALSPSTFEKGLRYYLNGMNSTAVTPVDLHIALQRALDEDQPTNDVNIGRLMETWENQSGYPVISVRKDGRNVILSQKRFLDENSNQIYAIPITYATKSKMDFDSTTVDVNLIYLQHYLIKIDSNI